VWLFIMNNRVTIVTDSTACLLPDQIKQFEIEVVPVVYIIDGQAYRDGLDMTTAEFYTRLKQAKKLPTTSGSLTESYFEAFQRASQKADHILCITISSRLSGMYDAARIAVQTAQKGIPGIDITVVDSYTAAGAQGLVVTAAARAAAAGKSMEEVVQITREVVRQVHLYAMLDTLDYLVKGGRAPRAAAIATSILQIKPIFTIKEGVASSYLNVRTTRNAFLRLVSLIEEKKEPGLPFHVSVMHADALTDALIIMEEIKTRFKPQEQYICEFTPVMGVHTGPGLVGVAFYSGEY
jgi:DegV family protein with EDD domain